MISKKVKRWIISVLYGSAEPDTYYKLGYAYRYGIGVAKNEYAALYIFKCGCDLNHSECMVEYCEMTGKGKWTLQAWKLDSNVHAAYHLIMAIPNDTLEPPYSRRHYYIDHLCKIKKWTSDEMISFLCKPEIAQKIFDYVGRDVLFTMYLEHEQYRSAFMSWMRQYMKDDRYTKSIYDFIETVLFSKHIDNIFDNDNDMFYDLFIDMDLTSIPKAKKIVCIVQNLLIQNTNVMELHMKFAPGGEGYFAAKHDFYEKISK